MDKILEIPLSIVVYTIRNKMAVDCMLLALLGLFSRHCKQQPTGGHFPICHSSTICLSNTYILHYKTMSNASWQLVRQRSQNMFKGWESAGFHAMQSLHQGSFSVCKFLTVRASFQNRCIDFKAWHHSQGPTRTAEKKKLLFRTTWKEVFPIISVISTLLFHKTSPELSSSALMTAP